MWEIEKYAIIFLKSIWLKIKKFLKTNPILKTNTKKVISWRFKKDFIIIEKMKIPNLPIFNKIAAKMIDPKDIDSTWAFGS